MEDDLKHVLEKAHSIAVGLNQVKRLINPQSELSRRSYSRIKQLETELQNHSRYTPKPASRSAQATKPTVRGLARQAIRRVRQQQTLGRRLFHDGHRVTLSKAGKPVISQYLSEEANVPPMFRSADALRKHSLLIRKQHQSRTLAGEKECQSVLPSACSAEQALVLPTFQEFAEANEVVSFVKKGSAELVHRIDKAIHRVEKLSKKLDAFGLQSAIESVPRRRNGLLHSNPNTQNLNAGNMATRLRKIQETISLMYKPTTQSLLARESARQRSDSVRPKPNALANGMVEQANQQKYITVKTRVGLISQESKKPLSREQSLAQFNKYRRSVDTSLRYQTYRVHQQGLAYVYCLNTRVKNHSEPTEAELMLLEIWRQVLLRGWTLTARCLQQTLDVFTETEKTSAAFQILFRSIQESLE